MMGKVGVYICFPIKLTLRDKNVVLYYFPFSGGRIGMDSVTDSNTGEPGSRRAAGKRSLPQTRPVESTESTNDEPG